MTTAPDWPQRAHRLAAQLAENGVLNDPAWRAAVEAVPRHVFVPTFHVQQPGGKWTSTSLDDDIWLDAVYSDAPLVTAIAENTRGTKVIVSSSTKPALMVRMLEALDVREGQKMLEIGTGTGYNAALLSHRLGEANVFSVDIDPVLVDLARERLAALGYRPILAALHGARGLPVHAPFDRIIATCSVPAVPWAWAEQTRPGGLILVDVKHGTHAGNLVLLRRHPDRLEGRFLPRWAGFMAIRDGPATPATVLMPTAIQPDQGRQFSTRLDPTPWTAAVPWFLAAGNLPRQLGFGYRGHTDTGPTWAVFTGNDRSWCKVRIQPDQHGYREVQEGGPIAIWTRFEEIHAQWDELGRPGWDRLGLTATPDGRHRIWLDEPNGEKWLLTEP